MSAKKFIISYVWCFLFIISCVSTSYNKDLIVKTAQEYTKDGLYKEAIELYQKVLRKNPEDYETRKLLGIVLVKAKSYKNAIQHLEYVIDKLENDFEANFYLAEAYRVLNKYAEAIYRYQKALKIDNSNEQALKSLAWSYFKIRYYTESLTIAEGLYKTLKNDPQTVIILSRIYIKLKRYDDAQKILDNFRPKVVKQFKPYFQSIQAEIFAESGNCTQAIPLYQKAIDEKPFLSSALLGLGKCLVKEQNSKGIVYLERAIRSKPNLIEGYLWLAKFYESKSPQKALKYYETFHKLAHLDPDFIDQIPEVRHKINTLKLSVNKKTPSQF